MRTGTGIFDTERGFTGQIRDATTGLNFYNARYQDPVLGRFISPDSIVPNPANPVHFNRFVYVDNRPLILIDPSGHCGLTDVAGGVGWECSQLWGQHNFHIYIQHIHGPASSDAINVVELASDLNDAVVEGVKEGARRGLNQIGDTLGVERIYIETTPAGNKMPVIQGRQSGLNLVDGLIDGVLDTGAITLPGVVLAESTEDPEFIRLHEGQHFDDWLEFTSRSGNPWLWHLTYGAELAAETVIYGSYDTAYENNSWERRARDARSGSLPPSGAREHLIEEVSSFF